MSDSEQLNKKLKNAPFNFFGLPKDIRLLVYNGLDLKDLNNLLLANKLMLDEIGNIQLGFLFHKVKQAHKFLSYKDARTWIANYLQEETLLKKEILECAQNIKAIEKASGDKLDSYCIKAACFVLCIPILTSIPFGFGLTELDLSILAIALITIGYCWVCLTFNFFMCIGLPWHFMRGSFENPAESEKKHLNQLLTQLQQLEKPRFSSFFNETKAIDSGSHSTKDSVQTIPTKKPHNLERSERSPVSREI